MYAPVQNYNESRSESRSVINKISKNTDITVLPILNKESTGVSKILIYQPLVRFGPDFGPDLLKNRYNC